MISREYNVIISLSTNQLLRFTVCSKEKQQGTSKNREIVSKEKFIVKEIFVWIQVVQGRKSIVLKYFNFVLQCKMSDKINKTLEINFLR